MITSPSELPVWVWVTAAIVVDATFWVIFITKMVQSYKHLLTRVSVRLRPHPQFHDLVDEVQEKLDSFP